MKQAKLAETAFHESPNDNLSIPYGLIRTLRHFLEFVGILSYIRSLKTKGVRLDLIVVALGVYTMYESNSMASCAKWLENPAVRRAIGFSVKDEISQRTLNRALDTLGDNREGVITKLWEGIRTRFEIDDYDIDLDGSAVVLYGPKSSYGAVGYGRDKNRGKLQVEFMVAQLASLGIPIYIKPYRGNTSDEAQYRDCVPELAGLLSGGGIHGMDVMKEQTSVPDGDEDLLAAVSAVAMLGAAIVADNGAASKNNTDRIGACGFSYLTRVQLNASDVKNIEEHCAEFEYLGDGMFCYKKHFKESGRTTYLFLSRDLLVKGRRSAERRLEKALDDYRKSENRELRVSDYVSVRFSFWIGTSIKIWRQEQLVPLTEGDKARFVRKRMGLKCGFFKLQSDRDMTPAEALKKYRRRVAVEHLISSLKRVTGIKPIRVWNERSVNGSMMLALLTEAAIGMARHCMAGKEKKHGKRMFSMVHRSKPSTESIVASLTHLTLTSYRDGKGPYKTVISNWDPISKEIFEHIHAHEGLEWGFRKIPADTSSGL